MALSRTRLDNLVLWSSSEEAKALGQHTYLWIVDTHTAGEQSASMPWIKDIDKSLTHGPLATLLWSFMAGPFLSKQTSLRDTKIMAVLPQSILIFESRHERF
jgi:hypothetical protein